jgi:hypothetical protein
VIDPTIHKLMLVAVGHHQAGRLAQAEPMYKQVLARDPNNADALHLLVVMENQLLMKY